MRQQPPMQHEEREAECRDKVAMVPPRGHLQHIHESWDSRVVWSQPSAAGRRSIEIRELRENWVWTGHF